MHGGPIKAHQLGRAQAGEQADGEVRQKVETRGVFQEPGGLIQREDPWLLVLGGRPFDAVGDIRIRPAVAKGIVEELRDLGEVVDAGPRRPLVVVHPFL